MSYISRFTVTDYVIFFLTIAISMSIGIFFAACERRKKHTTPEHYFLADRKLKSLPVALSFVVTFQSSILFLGFPAEGYLFGSTLAFHAISYAMGTLFSALVVIPLFHPLKLMSVYQYLYLRYGNRYLQMFTLVSGMTYTLLYMGTVTYGTCVALELVVGIPVWATIVIYTTVTSLYTAIGGIKAVVWTDVFQFIIMFTGIVSVLVKATYQTGGVASVFQYGKDRFNYIEISLDPRIRYTVWNLTFGSITIFIYFTFMQPAMQRIYSTPSVRTARLLYLFSIPVYSMMMILAFIQGCVVFAYYSSKRCDILQAKIVKNVNGIIPFAVMDLFRNQPGLPGLFIAALSSAALSTLSSCLSGLSAITYTDIIKVKYTNMNVETATKLSKIFVLLYGLVALGIAFLCSAMPGSVMAIFTAMGACLDGPTVGIFLLSAMFRRSTTKGLFIGALFGTCVPLWIYFGRTFSNVAPDPVLPSGPVDQCYKLTASMANYNISDISYIHNTTFFQATTEMHQNNDVINEQSPLSEFYKMSFMLWSLTGFLITVVIGTVGSLLTKPPAEVDERCLFSFRKHVIDELFTAKRQTSRVTSVEEIRLTSQ